MKTFHYKKYTHHRGHLDHGEKKENGGEKKKVGGFDDSSRPLFSLNETL